MKIVLLGPPGSGKTTLLRCLNTNVEKEAVSGFQLCYLEELSV